MYAEDRVKEIESVLESLYQTDPKFVMHRRQNGVMRREFVPPTPNLESTGWVFTMSAPDGHLFKYYDVKFLQESKSLVEELKKRSATEIMGEKLMNPPKSFEDFDALLSNKEEVSKYVENMNKKLTELYIYNIIRKDFTINHDALESYEKLLEVDAESLKDFYCERHSIEVEERESIVRACHTPGPGFRTHCNE